MRIDVIVAGRQALRGRDRTRALVASLAGSSFVLVVSLSLVAGVRHNLDQAIRVGIGGDLQVAAAANPVVPMFGEVPVTYRPLPDASRIARALGERPEVREVAERSSATAMVSTADAEAPAVLVGIAPEQEARTVARLTGHRREAADVLGERDALLGAAMAARLGVDGDGDEVTILVPTADGLFDGDVFRVRALYVPQGMPVMDELVIFVNLARLKFMLGESDSRNLVVRLEDAAGSAAAADRMQSDLAAAGWSVDVRTSDELAADFLGISKVGGALIGLGLAFAGLIVALGTANGFLILFLERERELGLMRALGAGRVRIVMTLVIESTILSSVAAAAGVVVGIAVCLGLGIGGIPAASTAMTYAFGGERLVPVVGVGHVVTAVGLVALIGPLATVVPALRASSVDPAETMRAPE